MLFSGLRCNPRLIKPNLGCQGDHQVYPQQRKPVQTPPVDSQPTRPYTEPTPTRPTNHSLASETNPPKPPNQPYITNTPTVAAAGPARPTNGMQEPDLIQSLAQDPTRPYLSPKPTCTANQDGDTSTNLPYPPNPPTFTELSPIGQ